MITRLMSVSKTLWRGLKKRTKGPKSTLNRTLIKEIRSLREGRWVNPRLMLWIQVTRGTRRIRGRIMRRTKWVIRRLRIVRNIPMVQTPMLRWPNLLKEAVEAVEVMEEVASKTPRTDAEVAPLLTFMILIHTQTFLYFTLIHLRIPLTCLTLHLPPQ